MADLTRELPVEMRGKGIVDPGPRGPSWIEGLAGIARAGSQVIQEGRQTRAQENRDAAANELAGEAFNYIRDLNDLSTRANQPPTMADELLPGIENPGGPTIDPAILEEAAQMRRMTRANEQGRLSKAALDVRFESTISRLMNQYPDQRADIMKAFREYGLDHVLFRAFDDEQARYENDREIQMKGEATAAARAVQAGSDPTTPRPVLVAQGMRLLEADEQAQVLSRRLQAAEGQAALEGRISEAAQQTLNTDATRVILDRTRVVVGANLSSMMALVTAASDNPEALTRLSQEVIPQMRALITNERMRMEADLSSSGLLTEDTRKVIMETFDNYTKQLNDFVAGDASVFKQNSMALQNFQNQLKLNAEEALPLYSELVELFGRDFVNTQLAGDLSMLIDPQIRDGLTDELKGFRTARSVEARATLNRVITALRTQNVNLQEMPLEEAERVLRVTSGQVRAHANAINTGQDVSSPRMAAHQEAYGRLVVAAVEIQPDVADWRDVKSVAEYITTPGNRAVLEKAYANPATQDAAQQNILLSRVAASQFFAAAQSDPRRTQAFEGAQRVVFENGQFVVRSNRAGYDRWAAAERDRAVGRLGAITGGVQEEVLVPTWEEFQRRADPRLVETARTMNMFVDHLVATDKFDPSVAANHPERERRLFWAGVGGSLRPKPADGQPDDGLTGTESLEQAITNLSLSLGRANAEASAGLTQVRGNPSQGEADQAIREEAQSAGLDPALFFVMRGIESGGDNNARNPRSSATGPFQFLDSTWRAMGGGDRTDPVLSGRRAVQYAAQNADQYEEVFGRAPANWEIYMMHQQGPAGAIAMLRNPNEKAIDVLKNSGVSPRLARQAILNNGGTEDMTAAQFTQLWRRKYENRARQFAAR